MERQLAVTRVEILIVKETVPLQIVPHGIQLQFAHHFASGPSMQRRQAGLVEARKSVLHGVQA